MKSLLKSAVLFAATIVDCSCSNSTDEAPGSPFSYVGHELNCPVVSMEVNTYDAKSKFGEVQKDGESKEIVVYEFDGNGYVVTKTAYYSDREIRCLNRYKYSNSNNSIEEHVYSYDGELSSIIKHEYKASGDLLSKIEYDAEGNEIAYVKCEYKGNLIAKESHDTEHYNFEYVYEIVDSKMKSYSSYSDGILQSVTKYTKFDLNREISGIEYNASGDREGEFCITYYKKGKINSYCYRLDKNPDQIEYGYAYNDKCLLTQRTFQGKTTEYEYEYDKKGNWIKRTEFNGDNKKPVEIVERTIIY